MNDRDQERQLQEILARLRSDYERAAKPYIDQLYALRCMGHQPAMIVTYEQARGLGFEIVKETRLTPNEIGKAMEGK